MTPLQILFDILRLRRGPQDLPASWTFAGIMLGIYLVFGVYTGQALDSENPASTGLAIAALQFTAVAVLLTLRKFPERLPQTLSALAGVGIILGVLSFAFLVQADPNRQQPVLAMAWFAVFFWSLVVDGHIYRHALSISMQQGILVAVLLLAASYVMVELVISPASNPA
ncbi:MAG: hypothetical protein R3348_01595 [Xanthomonadales bacterium]|nr:hypothetical protein [Xanthomonadales bacterium]